MKSSDGFAGGLRCCTGQGDYILRIEHVGMHLVNGGYDGGYDGSIWD